ncbi:MAG: RIP metalloprotease RseP [Gammaproteobacteria bacterium]|nr:RIP metalloprotease RseP [Gammaproteobacteria bacterium]
MDFIWTIAGFVVAVSLLVTIHEFGHYWVARKLGFKVLRFSVGFGTPLWKRTAGADRTEYVFAMWPLGGYVKLLDEREGPVPPEDLARSFTRKKPWERILVLLAGPAFNIFFAIIVLAAMLWVSGSPEVRPVVGRIVADSVAAQAGLQSDDVIVAVEGKAVSNQTDVLFGLIEGMSESGPVDLRVRRGDAELRDLQLRIDDPEVRRALTEPAALLPGIGMRFWSPPIPAVIGKADAGGPADAAGLRAGDRIVAVDGVEITNFPMLVEAISVRPNRAFSVTYERAGVQGSTVVTTTADLVEGREVGRIRIQTPPPPPWPASMIEVVRFGPLEAVAEASVRAWDMTVLQAKMFWRMIFGQVSLKNLSGPISIAEYAGDSARSGLAEFLGFLVVISLSLGFLNLLPIPILDGGQIVYQLAEWVRGSPLSDRLQAIGQQVGVALLVMLMGIALFNDFARQFG